MLMQESTDMSEQNAFPFAHWKLLVGNRNSFFQHHKLLLLPWHVFPIGFARAVYNHFKIYMLIYKIPVGSENQKCEIR